MACLYYQSISSPNSYRRFSVFQSENKSLYLLFEHSESSYIGVVSWNLHQSLRIQLYTKLELSLFSGLSSTNSVICVRSYKPFVNLLTSSAGLVGFWNSFCSPAWAVDCWSSEENLDTQQDVQKIQQIDESPTGTNTTNWMGRRWNLEIKVIPIFDSNWNLPIGAWNMAFKNNSIHCDHHVCIPFFLLLFIHELFVYRTILWVVGFLLYFSG